MPLVADPVSWLMIRPGWDVFAVDGTKFGEVDLVAGDDTADIFDGLAIKQGTLSKDKKIQGAGAPLGSAAMAMPSRRSPEICFCKKDTISPRKGAAVAGSAKPG